MACPTCGGMFANNTKFLDHIRRQTSLDRKRSEKGHGCRLGVGVRGTFPGEGTPEGICKLATSTLRAQSPTTVSADRDSLDVVMPCLLCATALISVNPGSSPMR